MKKQIKPEALPLHLMMCKAFLLDLLTHFGETPAAEILFPQYFDITRRYTKQKHFLGVFLLFTASVRLRPPGPPLVPGVLLLSFIIMCNNDKSIYRSSYTKYSKCMTIAQPPKKFKISKCGVTKAYSFG